MEKVKIGFVGTGQVAYRHLKEFDSMKNVEVTAVFDPKPENVEKFISQAPAGGIATYENFEELIKKSGVDGVVICSPHAFHLPQMRFAMDNGVNVMVEKPAVVTHEDYLELRDVVERTGGTLVVGYQRHYMPLVIGAKKLIEEGSIGDIFFISGFLAQDWVAVVKKAGRIWRLDPELSGRGQLTDSGSHFTAMLFFLTGMTAEEVGAFIDFHGEKVDVNTAFIVKFKEKAAGNFGILGVTASYGEYLMLWGKKGLIKLSLSENSYVQFNGEEKTREIPQAEPEAKSPADDFVKCILNKKKPATSLSVIEKVALLSDKIYEAYNSGTIAKV
ncbi:MAG: Gfo/Idh/MocA family oxidoreductase [Candidatus Omnitrophica bacterium]|nr:Gfo/Idh/MocA family oxidoreductase [Candidatus Omnitrophota bacterium]